MTRRKPGRIRTCTGCGKPVTSASQYVTACSACVKRRMRLAREDRYVYVRTHVHVWPDGRRTIETGTECGEMCA